MSNSYDAAPDEINVDVREKIAHLSTVYGTDEDGTISFSRACEGELNQLGQYAAAFVDGFEGKPTIAADLVTGDAARWDTLRITPRDFIEFTTRLEAYKQREMAKILGELSSP